MRRGDTLSRVGGTTFAVLFLDTTIEEARLLAGEAQAVFAGERVAEIDQAPVPDGREIVELRFAMPTDPPQPVSRLAQRRIAFLLRS